MSNNSIDSSQAAEQLLHALAEQIAANDEHYTLAVVGGSALLDAARWSRSHDPSEGYRSVLAQVLAHFGVDDGQLDS
jgi:hypothetical protein